LTADDKTTAHYLQSVIRWQKVGGAPRALRWAGCHVSLNIGEPWRYVGWIVIDATPPDLPQPSGHGRTPPFLLIQAARARSSSFLVSKPLAPSLSPEDSLFGRERFGRRPAKKGRTLPRQERSHLDLREALDPGRKLI
jgi:hypothetical protein